jgi:hypothetical protein
MSSVLWANILVNGKVDSDESDRYALYRHSKKLNKLTKKLKITAFDSLLDYTDVQFNLSDEDLPEGMESTDELMAENGVWVPGAEAVEMLESLILHISTDKVKFGLVNNDADEVLVELEECLVNAEKAKNTNGMFNFSVVM